MNTVIEEMEEALVRINNGLMDLNVEMASFTAKPEASDEVQQLRAKNEELRRVMKKIITYIPGDVVDADLVSSQPIDTCYLKIVATKLLFS